MPLERLDVFPSFFPIPHPDCHIIAGSEDKGLCRVHNDCSDVIWVCFERGTAGRATSARGHTSKYLIRLTSSLRCCSCKPAIGSHRNRTRSNSTSTSAPSLHSSFFLDLLTFRSMNRPARTGTSVSSKVLTICCVRKDQMYYGMGFLSAGGLQRRSAQNGTGQRHRGTYDMAAVERRENPWLCLV
jgi:hypothetical protein